MTQRAHKKALLTILVLFYFLTLNSMADFKGSIDFNTVEISDHKAQAQNLVEVAFRCLKKDLDLQQSFFNKHGIAAFYGDRSSFGNMTDSQKRKELQRLGKDPNLLSEMRSTSCVGLVLECLGEGFSKTKQSKVWERIYKYTLLNDADGMALQVALQKLGWKILYWNANPSQNILWDREEYNWDPKNKAYFHGDHFENYNNVIRRGRYFYTQVDDNKSLSNLSQFTDSNRTYPEKFLKIPFFVGIAHMGYHVFPGFTGAQIIEAHSTRKITDPKTVQSGPFNPLHGGSPDGAPTGQAYRSGLIAIPPGYEL